MRRSKSAFPVTLRCAETFLVGNSTVPLDFWISRFLDFWNRSSTSPLTPNRATRLCIFNSGGFRAVTKYDFDLRQIIFRAVTNMISIQSWCGSNDSDGNYYHSKRTLFLLQHKRQIV